MKQTTKEHPSLISTGQLRCYDENGTEIPCSGTGQDAEHRFGANWPQPRFELADELVLDQLTGLTWTKNANLSEFPVTWKEAFACIDAMNRTGTFGFTDWRLPNRNELRSLMSYQTRKPSLPESHPFANVFLGWYWTSTSAAMNPAYAWYIHLEGARMFYGQKDQYCLFWPVRGKGNSMVHSTGQKKCYDASGAEINCSQSGQDGEFQYGSTCPSPRFAISENTVIDIMTGITWLRQADISDKPLSWRQAFSLIDEINHRRLHGVANWRLPDINMLASLADCSEARPALATGHPFTGLRDVYWSSTTSFFETDWAWALYLEKGALGVGHKKGESFFVWPASPGQGR